MSGNKMGAIKAKLGLRGPTKPGEMIARMNKIKSDSLKVETKGDKKPIIKTITKII